MQKQDPHSYADLEQGQIVYITLRMFVNFPDQVLHVTATYTLKAPINGSFYMDMRDLDLHRIHKDGEVLLWEIDATDPIFGERLHLKELKGIKEFTVEFFGKDFAVVRTGSWTIAGEYQVHWWMDGAERASRMFVLE